MSGATAKKLEEKTARETKRGLCPTCVLEAECTFPKTTGRPVMHCDEFEGLKTGAKAEQRVVMAASQMTASDLRPRAALGLCSICDRREGCTFPKREGGVLCCEEYA